MKIKVSEASELQLDWLVAKCKGLDVYIPAFASFPWLMIRTYDGLYSCPSFSTDWAAGGPLIEQAGILLRPLRKEGHSLDGVWLAMLDGVNTGSMVKWVKRPDWPRHYLEGPTPLIASMRCLITSELGEEVEVPKELV